MQRSSAYLTLLIQSYKTQNHTESVQFRMKMVLGTPDVGQRADIGKKRNKEKK